jgi:hypothetical protein
LCKFFFQIFSFKIFSFKFFQLPFPGAKGASLPDLLFPSVCNLFSGSKGGGRLSFSKTNTLNALNCFFDILEFF